MFPTFASGDVDNLIWTVSLDGDLLIAAEYDRRGHPSITGFKPARIAGEIRRPTKGKSLLINVESGRYSRDYINRAQLLGNAKKSFERYFPEQTFEIQIIEGRCAGGIELVAAITIHVAHPRDADAPVCLMKSEGVRADTDLIQLPKCH